jgi:hypothetical protein
MALELLEQVSNETHASMSSGGAASAQLAKSLAPMVRRRAAMTMGWPGSEAG